MDKQQQAYERAQAKKKVRGLIHVYTGDGKGKTTAALGISLRMIGYDRKVCIVQFIKGTWHYGELDAVNKHLSAYMEIIPAGKGFVGILGDNKPRSEHEQAAMEALELARQKMQTGEYTLIVLDEINVAVSMGLIGVDDVLALIKEKPEGLHLILTGRDAHPAIIEKADLVTEMKLIKHYFNKGIGAVKGMEY